MRFKHKKSGFTLLEIIIVIIIVGVLASLALPRFFRTVEYSRSTEAMQSLSSIRNSVERCYLQRSSYATCNAFSSLDLADPGATAGSLFAYTFTGTWNAANFQLTATRNTVDGGDGASTVRLTSAAGDVTRSGTGAFSGIQ